MASGDPLVSVVLAVYNVAPYLPETLASLSRQHAAGLEVILVDDGSTDGTRDIVRTAEREPHIRAIYHDSNKGVAAARNAALDVARGTYIAFADGDDVLHPEMLRTMHAAACEQGVDIVTCGYSTFQEGEQEASARPAPFRFPTGRRLSGDDLRRVRERGHRDKLYWFAPLFLYRRELLDGARIRFDPTVPLGSDSMFNVRALHAAESVYGVPRHLYLVRHRRQSMTSHGSPAWNTKIGVQYRALRRFYESEGIWSRVAPDYYRYVLDFSLPQAMANACTLAVDRAHLRNLLGEIRRQDWVADALAYAPARSGLTGKRRLVVELLSRGHVAVLARLYERRIGRAPVLA